MSWLISSTIATTSFPKDELLEKLWPGQVVSETALTRGIVAARKAMGDDGGRQDIIKTQHGRGYRFVVEVTEQAKAPEALPEETTDPLHPAPSQVLPSPVSTGEAWPERSRRGQGEGLAQPLSGASTLLQPPVQRLWPRRTLVLSSVLLLVGIMGVWRAQRRAQGQS
jgi:hypothetical protein